jgi:thiamine transport system permease protein
VDRYPRLTKASVFAARSAIPALSVAVVVAPLAAVLSRAASEPDAFGQVLRSARMPRILLFTLQQASLSVAISVLIGLGVAVLVYLEAPCSRLAMLCTSATFALPTMVVGAAWLALDIPRGMFAIATAHAFFNTGLVARWCCGAQASIRQDLVDQARILGASQRQELRALWWPIVRRSVGQAATVVALLCVTSLGIVSTLAAERQGTIETEIVRHASSLITFPRAAWLGLGQLLLLIPLILLAGKARDPAATPAFSLAGAQLPIQRDYARGGTKGIGGVFAIVIIVLWTIPIVRVVQQSDLAALERITPDLTGTTLTAAIVSSIRSAATAAALAVLIASACVLARGRVAWAARAVSTTSLAISPALLGFGMLLLFRSGPLDLRVSPLRIPIAQSLLALPFAIFVIHTAHRQVPEDRRQIARMLGAGAVRRFWHVELRALRSSLRSASAIAFVIALGDVATTTLLARPNEPSLPLLIARCFSRPGSAAREAGIAAAVILLCLCTLSLWLGHARFTRPQRRWSLA